MMTNDTDVKFVATDGDISIQQEEGTFYFVEGQDNNQIRLNFGQQTMSSTNGDMITYGRTSIPVLFTMPILDSNNVLHDLEFTDVDIHTFYLEEDSKWVATFHKYTNYNVKMDRQWCYVVSCNNSTYVSNLYSYENHTQTMATKVVDDGFADGSVSNYFIWWNRFDYGGVGSHLIEFCFWEDILPMENIGTFVKIADTKQDAIDGLIEQIQNCNLHFDILYFYKDYPYPKIPGTLNYPSISVYEINADTGTKTKLFDLDNWQEFNEGQYQRIRVDSYSNISNFDYVEIFRTDTGDVIISYENPYRFIEVSWDSYTIIPIESEEFIVSHGCQIGCIDSKFYINLYYDREQIFSGPKNPSLVMAAATIVGKLGIAIRSPQEYAGFYVPLIQQ